MPHKNTKIVKIGNDGIKIVWYNEDGWKGVGAE
jgi:hypothetical protein